MSTAVQRRRGTTTQHSTFTGLDGEITVDTTKHTAVVHDGATAGGFALSIEGHTHTAANITDSTTAGRALLTAASAAAQRTALSLGTAAQSASTDFAAASHTHALSSITQSSATSGQVPTWNGTAWAPATPASGGVTGFNGRTGAVTLSNTDVTTALAYTPLNPTRLVNAGTGLSGGGDLSADRTISLANTTVAAATYGSATQSTQFTVDAQGRLTAASNLTITPAFSSLTGVPTTLSGYGITDAQPLNTSLTSIGGLSGTTGFLKKTAAGTYALDTSITADASNNVTIGGKIIAATHGSPAATALTVQSAGTTAMTIDTSQNVGIGTSSPANTLHLYRNSTSQTSLNVEAGAAASFAPAIYLTDSRTGSVKQFQLAVGGYTNAFYIQDQTAGALRFLIDSSGNVGIGTTSPSNALDVNGISRFRQEVQFNPSGTVQSRIGISTYSGSNTVFAIGNDSGATANNIAFYNAGSERMRIDSSGNVGIGTSSPGTQLNVYKSTATQVAIRPQNSLAYADFGPISDGTVYGPYAAPAASTGLIVGTSNSNPVQLWTNGSERMRIDSSGNVGIGTSSPGALLHVSNASAVIRIGLTATSQYTDIYRDNATGYTVYNAAQAANFRGHIWQLGGTEAMRIDSSGNVNVGSSAPVNPASLSILKQTTALSGTTNSFGMYLYPTSSGVCYIDAITSTSGNSSLTLRTYNNGTYNTLAMDNGGNVTSSGSLSDSIGNVRNVPQNAQTSAYVLVATDNGKHIAITTGGVTVNSGIFSAGQSVTVYNNSASSQTITQGTSVTMYQVGTANTGNRTLAQRGLCTIFCVASNTFVITGGGLT